MFKVAISAWAVVFLTFIVLIYRKELTAWFHTKFHPRHNCEHKRFTRKQWFAKDGTPMIYFNCWDCGYRVHSHVIGNPDEMKKNGWEKEEYGEGAFLNS